MSASVLAFSQEKRCFLSCHGQIKCKLHHPGRDLCAAQRVLGRLLHYRSAIQMDAVAPGTCIMTTSHGAVDRPALGKQQRTAKWRPANRAHHHDDGPIRLGAPRQDDASADIRARRSR
jgi:hypothetical protein